MNPIIKPTKAKIVFIILYILLLFFAGYIRVTDSPQPTGFPFTYQIEGCGMTAVAGCVNELYPHMLLLDILIPVAIYLGIGYLQNRKKTN